MTQQMTLDFAREQGRRGALRAQVRAEHDRPSFTADAAAFMWATLAAGPTSGEDLTDAAKAAGFRPPDDRAFGAVFRMLVASGARVTGLCARRKGHGSAGGKVYAR